MLYDLLWDDNYKAFVPHELTEIQVLNTYRETIIDVMEFISS